MAKRGDRVVGESARGRAITFFLVIIVIVALILIYIYYKRSQVGVPGGAGLTHTPGIESIPGAGQTTTEYVKIQERQNILAAQQAAQQGTSAVPTITRVSYFGPGEFLAPGATKPGCTPDDLRRARLAGVTADELRCKGCTLAELRAAGFTAGELANAGFSPNDLRNAGFSADQLRQAGLNAADARRAGFNAQQLAGAGYNAAELAKAGFSPDSLKGAGISDAALAAAGIGVRPTTGLPNNCSVDALKRARAQGVTVAQLKKLGCGAAALLAAGYTPAELRAAGFLPEELKAAGVNANALRAAGFTPGDLRRAGFTATDLKNAGFSPADLKAAGFGANALREAGFTPNQILGGGYTNGDLVRAGFPASQIGGPSVGPTDCSVETLRRLRAQGVSARELKDRGCSAAALLAAGYTPAELKAAGFSDDDLRRAGVNPAELAAAGALIANQCSVDALKKARAQSVSASELRKRGCSAAALRAAGYTAAELKAAGFGDDDLRNAGFSPEEVAAGSAGAGVIAGKAVVPSVGTSEMQLQQLQASQEKQLNEQQRQDKMTQVETVMAAQANTLFNNWAPPTTQQYIEGTPPKKEETKTETTTATTVTQGAVVPGTPAAAATAAKVCASIKAGDVVMGVLTSTVNSDENSPVMATIVSGRLKGAKLIGQFSLLKEKVILNFSKLSLGCSCASIGISAVAIDPETAHTALATAVDHHYLLRYGTLFASSFLSGVADAISQSGSQTSTGSGGILVTHDKLSVVESAFVGLGAVGSQYASVLGSNFTRPPTVTVDAGSSIGVLFMQDLGDDAIECYQGKPLICDQVPSTAPLCGGASACPAIPVCPPVAMPCPVIPR